MPIPAELRRQLYNTGPWRELSADVRFVRAGGQCECRGECGKRHEGIAGVRCPEIDGADGVEQRGVVRLQTAHWYQSETGLMVPSSRVVALCGGCHLRYDMPSHLTARRRRRRREEISRTGQRDFWEATPS